MALGIFISVVAGPGYAHRDELKAYVDELNAEASRLVDSGFLELPPGYGPLVTYTHATNVMSRMMEGVDLAICSAGRTVYELAHMRIPAIVFAHHAREDMHTFARPANGFTYLGVMETYDTAAVQKAFTDLCEPAFRRNLYDRMCGFDFTRNKARVIASILALLQEEKTA